MEIKKITAKTIAAIISAKIKEDADDIAEKIVADAKMNELDFQTLVKKYLLNEIPDKIDFKTFAQGAFDQMKDAEKLLEFRVSITSDWEKCDDVFKCTENNNFQIYAKIDHIEDEKYKWNKTIFESGNIVQNVYESFRIQYQSYIDKINNKETEVIL
ncbi:MAG: hypothetical protein LBN95_03860 [Prevotellaceae bacterium]|jgi:hypothetical protein|nr:hypothetical protein [Prevotellaceae bacterium]